MATEPNPYRRLMLAAVSSVLVEAGIDTAEAEVLETLNEMVQAFLVELGFTAKNYYELSGRTEPLIADVILAFVAMGIDFSKLNEYAKKIKHIVLPNLQPHVPTKGSNMLQAGVKQQLPAHIPPHLPQFPDPHAYIRTPTHKQPVIDYEAIREKFAAQKRDVEKALTKFLTKTNPTHNLFENDESIYLLIACKPTFPPYLSALMPTDQVFDTEELEYKVGERSPAKKRVVTDSEREKDTSQESEDMDDDDDEVQEAAKVEEGNAPSAVDIDNPFLAAAKLPAQPMDAD